MITPTRVSALRNARYKLVKVERPVCDRSLGEFEFYDLSPGPPSNPLGLDLATSDLLTNGGLPPASARQPPPVVEFAWSGWRSQPSRSSPEG
jgi:hypothetical protein